MANDPKTLNIITNLLTFTPGVKKVFGPAMTIGETYNDLFDYVIHNSNPGPQKIYNSDQLQLGPASQSGVCEAAGLPPC